MWDVKDGDGGSWIKNAFTIVRTDKVSTPTYGMDLHEFHLRAPQKEKMTYICSTREEKDAWVNAINECIINIPNLSKDKRDTKEIREAAFAGPRLL